MSNETYIHTELRDRYKTLSVIVPIFNEEKVIEDFHSRISVVLDKIPLFSEICYVNDGSCDSSVKIIYKIMKNDPRVAFINLSRNFGKEAALTAGLDYVKGDAVVVIDADLQDPPELIPELLNGLYEGYDVVYAQRASRKGETFLKKFTSAIFYRLMQHFGKVAIPKDTGDFRILNRRAVDALLRLREHHRFMKGLFTWIGFKQKAFPYERDARFAGETKFNYWKLWNFSLEGITSYTSAPLKLATYIGFSIAMSAFLYALYFFIKTLVLGDSVKGYPSLIIIILFLSGMQLICIGIIGEYLGRTYNESKRRPIYFINELLPSKLSENQDDKKN